MNTLRDEVKDAIADSLGDRPFMDVREISAEVADCIFDTLGIGEDIQDTPKNNLDITVSRRPKGKMKLYLARFEFISGEYGQNFSCLFYAKTPENLEKKIDRYLRGYYGREGFHEVDGDTYYYHSGEVAVKNSGWEEVEDMQQIINDLLTDMGEMR